MKTIFKSIYIIIFFVSLVLITPIKNSFAVGEESESKSPNPLSGNAEAIAEGKTEYRANCAYCHGLRANGKGRGLPNSADLRKFKRGYTAYFATVVNGYKTMPPWGSMGPLDFDQINKIGAYLESVAIRGANWQDPEEE